MFSKRTKRIDKHVGSFIKPMTLQACSISGPLYSFLGLECSSLFSSGVVSLSTCRCLSLPLLLFFISSVWLTIIVYPWQFPHPLFCDFVCPTKCPHGCSLIILVSGQMSSLLSPFPTTTEDDFSLIQIPSHVLWSYFFFIVLSEITLFTYSYFLGCVYYLCHFIDRFHKGEDLIVSATKSMVYRIVT